MQTNDVCHSSFSHFPTVGEVLLKLLHPHLRVSYRDTLNCIICRCLFFHVKIWGCCLGQDPLVKEILNLNGNIPGKIKVK